MPLLQTQQICYQCKLIKRVRKMIFCLIQIINNLNSEERRSAEARAIKIAQLKRIENCGVMRSMSAAVLGFMV
jgi:hypothetical protein